MMTASPRATLAATATITATVAAAALALTMAAAGAQEEAERIAFPAGYASGFQNYVSVDRVQNPDQVIRLFANDIALEGRGEDGRYREGSILVGEIYGARTDAEGNVLESSLGRRVRDKLAAVAVMEKRAGWGEAFPEELRNGDWDFAIFSPGGERLERDLDGCRACHAPHGDIDHVFSHEHLPE